MSPMDDWDLGESTPACSLSRTGFPIIMKGITLPRSQHLPGSRPRSTSIRGADPAAHKNMHLPPPRVRKVTDTRSMKRRIHASCPARWKSGTSHSSPAACTAPKPFAPPLHPIHTAPFSPCFSQLPPPPSPTSIPLHSHPPRSHPTSLSAVAGALCPLRSIS
jgi:hypothetical protein